MTDWEETFKQLDAPRMSVSWDDVTARKPRLEEPGPEGTRRISALAVALVVAIVGGLLLVRAFSGQTSRIAGQPATHPPAGTATASPPPPGWLRYTDGEGDSIDAPSAWNFNSNALPGLGDPTATFAFGTGPVPASGDCGPVAALKSMPPDGMLMVIMEYSSVDEPYTFPPRSSALQLGPLGGPSECWGVRNHLVLFEDGGRYFQVQVVFGADVPDSLTKDVVASLNSLSILPAPPSSQPAALCSSGDWIACPDASWVYRIMQHAHIFHLGHDGARAILGLASGRSFSLRTGAPPASCAAQTIDGLRICRVGRELAWRVHGVWIWLAPARSKDTGVQAIASLPSSQSEAALVEASKVTSRG